MYGYDIFHNDIMTTLLNSVRNNKNSNTYIFEGEQGLGIHDAARLFAKALVCTEISSAPCCSCPACLEAQSGSHPDIAFVKKPKDKATIGVEPIRNMINESLIKPFYTRHKVFIIDDGDLLTPQAQNAFLKIIEEPPQYAVFIIVVSSAQILLETVRSRAVTVAFPPVSDVIVRQYIESKYPNESRLDFLVKYCAGVPKYADKIIERTDFDELRDEVLNLVPRLLSKNKLYAYDLSDYIDKNKDNAPEIFDMLLMYLRDALVTATGLPEKVVNSDKSDKINLLAQKYSTKTLASAIDEMLTARKMLDRYVKASACILRAGLCIK